MPLKERIANIRALAVMVLLLLSAPITAETHAELTAPPDTVFADRFQRPGDPVKPVQPTGDISVEIASHWGGPVYGADIQGDHAYIANGRMLRILDISDETQPVEIGAIQLGTGSAGVRDVKVHSSYALVAADGGDWFSIIDVSNPASPIKVRSFSASTAGGAYAQTVELYGNHAYVRGMSGASGTPVRIYDISNPAVASQVGTVSSDVLSLVIHDGRLYAGRGGNPSLQVYDLTANPSQPPLIGTLFGGSPFGVMAAHGDFLYASAELPSNSALLTIDISNPGSPVITDVMPSSETLVYAPIPRSRETRIVAADGYLYYINPFENPRYWRHFDSLLVFDLRTTPYKPALLSGLSPHGAVERVLTVAEDRLYVADAAEGFVILDVSDHAQIHPLGKYHSPKVLRKMAADGDLLYVTDAWGGFTILDVSDLHTPSVVGNYLARRHDTAGIDAFGIDKVGDTVYLAGGGAGLLVVDVADPARPVTLGTMRISTMAFPSDPWCGARFEGIRVRNGIAYIGYYAHFCGSATAWLLSVDVSNPSALVAIDVHGAGSPCVSWTIGKMAFLFDDALLINCGNRIFDISDPSNLSLIRDYAPGNPFDFAVHEHLRFSLVDGSGTNSTYGGFWVHDLTYPGNPLPILRIEPGSSIGCGSFTNPSEHRDAITLQEGSDRAYVKNGSTLFVFDVGKPANPNAVCLLRMDSLLPGGAEKTWGLSAGLLVDEPRLFVSTETLGLTILDVQPSP